MAKQLTFDTGLVEYEINGYPVKLNPTDETFVAKLEEMFKSLDELQGRLGKGDGFSAFGELDGEMRGKIDALLGEGASDGLFPGFNCYAMSGGLPVWMNLVFALMDEVSSAYEREFGSMDARVKSINAKYGKMLAKYNAKGKR